MLTHVAKFNMAVVGVISAEWVASHEGDIMI